MSMDGGVGTGAKRVGAFFLALIPWALGIGAIAWVSVVVSVHQYRDQIRQEQRRAVYVGAGERPTKKITIEAPDKGCIAIARADYDAGSLTIYANDRCHSDAPVNNTYWHWEILSPDRTVINSGYDNGFHCPELHAGEKAECVLKVEDDDRTGAVRVWVARYSDEN